MDNRLIDNIKKDLEKFPIINKKIDSILDAFGKKVFRYCLIQIAFTLTFLLATDISIIPLIALTILSFSIALTAIAYKIRNPFTEKTRSIALLESKTDSSNACGFYFCSKKDANSILSDINSFDNKNSLIYNRLFKNYKTSNNAIELIVSEFFQSEDEINYNIFEDYMALLKANSLNVDYFVEQNIYFFLKKISNEDFTANKIKTLNLILTIKSKDYKKNILDYYKERDSLINEHPHKI